jgi:transcriptional regulator with XRE-family HTH domain
MYMVKQVPTVHRYGPHFLREWREWAEYTLEDAAEAVELSHAQLSRIERRLQPYSQPLLEALAKVYGAPSGAALLERDPHDNEIWKEIDRYAAFLRNR